MIYSFIGIEFRFLRGKKKTSLVLSFQKTKGRFLSSAGSGVRIHFILFLRKKRSVRPILIFYPRNSPVLSVVMLLLGRMRIFEVSLYPPSNFYGFD